MKVKELIEDLKKYDGNYKVVLYNHGRDAREKQDEILGSFEQELYDDNDDVKEKIVCLYEY